MPNYYQTLNIDSTATEQEILAAFDLHYNQWRHLVNHPDPNLASQANQAIQLLETIRTTLTDPVRRSAYDAGIGIGGVQGGLADPEALLQAATAPRAVVPPRPKPASGAPVTTFVDAWVCPRCQKSNAKGSRHCKECGCELAQQCPNCKKLFEKQANFCPSCGEQPQVFLQRKERERIAAEQLALQERKQALDAKLAEAETHLRAERYRLAKEVLAAPGELAPLDSGEVQQVENLRKQADAICRRATWKTIPFTAIICLSIGIVVPIWANNAKYIFLNDNTALLVIALISMLVGVIWPYFYFEEIGGKDGLRKDYFWAGMSSLVALAITPIVLGIAVIFIALLIFGSIFGSG